jgi:hypothetical protein
MSIKTFTERWLIPEWRHAWKMLSLWFSAVSGIILEIPDALQHGWIDLPDSLKAYISNGEAHHIAQVTLVAGMIGRLIQQRRNPP